MYIYYQDGDIPHIDITSLTEPRLLAVFANRFPWTAFGELYKLQEPLGREWYNHFVDKVMLPNTLSPSGAPVNQLSMNATYRKWDAWMNSAERREDFTELKLTDLRRAVGDFSASLCLKDFLCLNCGVREPHCLFLGTNTHTARWHPNYTSFGLALDKPLLQQRQEAVGCFSCDPENWYTTSMMVSHARCSPGACQCMPCSGRL